MPNIDRVNLDNNTTYDIIAKTGRGIVRGTMNTTTSTSTAFVVSADSGIESLYDGLTIVVKNTKVASASGCTLDLNGLGAKSIWLSQSNSACTTHWGLNQTYLFVYDETNTRWELQQGRDTDSNTQDVTTLRSQYSHPTTGTNGVKKYSLFARTEDGTYTSFTTNSGTGTKTFDTTTKFDLRKIFYYSSSSDVASNTVLSNNALTYAQALTELRYSANGVTTSASTSSFVANDPVYLVCVNCGNTCYQIVSPYYSKAPLSVTDGAEYVYILLGYMQNSYQMDLLVDNPMYQYNSDGTKLIPYTEGRASYPSGVNSHAEGRYTTASGGRSHAEGYKSVSSGDNSHAEGTSSLLNNISQPTTSSGLAAHSECIGTQAKGDGSHSEGGRTIANGVYSHAEGQYSLAFGSNAHSEGDGTISGGSWNVTTYPLNTVIYKGVWSSGTSYTKGQYVVYGDSNTHYICKANVSGTTTPDNDTSHWEVFSSILTAKNNAHTEGYGTIVANNSSHAEGGFSIASGDTSHAEGYSTIASGDYGSHAEGRSTTASGDSSHAEGNTTTASGDGSHAEGIQTIASGYCSHAEGYYTIAGGDWMSHAEGWQTKALSDYQHVSGKFNIADSNNTYVEIIGNGGSDTTRSNARTLDWDGTEWLAGGFQCNAMNVSSSSVNLVNPEKWRDAVYGVTPDGSSKDRVLSNLTKGSANIRVLEYGGYFGGSQNKRLKMTFPEVAYGKYLVFVHLEADVTVHDYEIFCVENSNGNGFSKAHYGRTTPSWTNIVGSASTGTLTWGATGTQIYSSVFAPYGSWYVKIIASDGPLETFPNVYMTNES